MATSYKKPRNRHIEVSKLTTHPGAPVERFEHKTLGSILAELQELSTQCMCTKVRPRFGQNMRTSWLPTTPSALWAASTLWSSFRSPRIKSTGKKALPSHLETPYVYVTGTKLNQVKDVGDRSHRRRDPLLALPSSPQPPM